VKARAWPPWVVTAAIIQRKHTNKLYNFPITAAGRCENLSHMCIKYARAERDYPVTQLQSQCTGRIFSFSDPAVGCTQRAFILHAFPLFFSAHCYCLDRVCICAVCVERRAAHDLDLSVYSITNGFHPLTHCQQLDLLFGDYAAFMPDLLFVIIWLTSHAVYNPRCAIYYWDTRTALRSPALPF
jgi:hypothetical protein